MNFTEENPAPEKRTSRPKKRKNLHGVKEWEALDAAAIHLTPDEGTAFASLLERQSAR